MSRQTTLPDDVLAARLPVWRALSELWLDTEHSPAALRMLAVDLAASPYTLAQIEDIHAQEVAPAVGSNLAGVAGEWAGFDPRMLAARCTDCALRRGTLRHRLGTWMLRSYVKRMTAEPWAQVRQAVIALRAARGDDDATHPNASRP